MFLKKKLSFEEYTYRFIESFFSKYMPLKMETQQETNFINGITMQMNLLMMEFILPINNKNIDESLGKKVGYIQAKQLINFYKSIQMQEDAIDESMEEYTRFNEDFNNSEITKKLIEKEEISSVIFAFVYDMLNKAMVDKSDYAKGAVIGDFLLSNLKMIKDIKKEILDNYKVEDIK